MKCPHCEYENWWSSEKLDIVEGDKGEFYQLPVDMTRLPYSYREERVKLFACPNCSKTFVEL